MSLNILQEIIRYLNIDCSVVNCYYPNPIEGLFYLVFFPSIIIIIFVYILSDVAMKKITGGEHKSIKLLIAISVFTYIILQGWFTVFVSITNAWFIITIVFLGVLVFISRFIGEDEKVKPHGTLSALMKYPAKRFRKEVIGDVKETEKEIENKLKQMETLVEELKEASRRGDSQGFGIVYNRFMAMENATKSLIDELKADIGTGIPRLDKISNLGKFEKRLNEISQRVAKIHTH